MKHREKETEIANGVEKDFRRPALIALLVFTIAFLGWQTVAEFLFGIRLLANLELALWLYMVTLLYFARRHSYSKQLALSYLIPLLSLILVAMANPETPPNVFIWFFLMPVLSYSLLGRQLGLFINSISILLALSAYLLHYADSPAGLHPLIISNALVCFSSIWVVMHLYERNREKTTDELRRMATTDELTGLHNRRQLERIFTHLASAAERQKQMLAVVVMDLDHFKRINDKWGHHGGDSVLKHIATLLRSQLRGSDWAFRIGGEEFCLFLPMVDREAAMNTAEMLRRRIAEHPCHFNGQTIPLSASIGVALYPENDSDFGSLLSLADERMYRAKQQGRNRIIGDDSDASPLSITTTTADITG